MRGTFLQGKLERYGGGGGICQDSADVPVGETQYEDSQVQFTRPIPDEVISVYEVYVKEETAGSEGRNDVTVVPSLPSTNDHQLIQGDCMNLNVAIDSEVINIDGAVTKFLGKDAFKYKILDQNVNSSNDNVMVYSHPVVEGPSSSSTRLIDKDDPRSKLHFVKYLKRDGKTLKIWECGICSKEFRHQYTLMRHLPTHTDERNFKCEACGKAFRQLSTLSQHKAIHSDARPYVCEFCKKTFNRVSTLISHRKTHSEHKPHKCQVCGKGFHQKGNLRNHVFTHTNERPYKCELCGKGFNQMSNLVCHKVKAHAHAEKMQHVCGICGKEFPRRFSLRSHEEYKHGIKYRHPAGVQTGINDPNVIRNKNVRIVQLPNGDRNQTIEVRDKDPLMCSDVMESVVIDKIDTKAMEMALIEGQTPFALFKPAKGIPVLVKVSPTGTHKNILTPATAEDLRMAGKMSLSPTITADPDRIKAVQVKVPVVATVIQSIDSDGKMNFIVEPPGPENEHAAMFFKVSATIWRLFGALSTESLVTALDSQFTYTEPARNEPDRQNGPVVSSAMEDCNELLELAAQGGIQFVRATEDGRYEVMTNSEARDLMAQNSHDVTILEGEEADAINVVNMRGNGEVIIGDSDNQIMVLDSASTQKSMPMDGIEILEDKDIRILDSKSLDDRFVDGISFLSQSKIDDLILGPKPLSIDGGVTVNDHEDEAIGVPSSQQELTNILSHRSDISTLSTTSQPSISSLLMKNHPPLSILNDTLPYLKSNTSLAEDLNILGSSTMDDHHSVYESKIKLPSVFDDPEPDTGLIPINQSDMKILGSGTSNKVLGSKTNCLPPSKLFPGLNEVKILGPKNHGQEIMTSQYQDIKLLSPYEQFLKNTASNTNGCDSGGVNTSGGCRKEVKILGKKLGTGIITSTEEGNVVEVIEEKTKLMMDGPGLCNPTDNTVISSPRLDRQITENGGPDSFLLQACSPCDSDFLNFENRLKDTSPAGHFERTQKDSRDSFSSTSGLPDLD
ncbi:Fez family zinc finger protein [Apis cerana cerana]|uniref:Fez family zinc finger protein n=1 Tax=Apis cerana cerana TaxID=94128 RepID=A0A2A3EJC3_APICC|nr:Fez family zinc finger protein [Apis cerana cerana]